MGGIIVDSGRFDWGQSGKFKAFTSPIEASGGWMGNNLIRHSFWHVSPAFFLLHSSILSQFFDQTFKERAFTTKLRYELLRDMGACLEPMSAWLLLQGCMYYSLVYVNQEINCLCSRNLVPQDGATPAECNGSCKVSGEASKSGLGIISRSSFPSLSRNSKDSPQRLRVYLGFRG